MPIDHLSQDHSSRLFTIHQAHSHTFYGVFLTSPTTRRNGSLPEPFQNLSPAGWVSYSGEGSDFLPGFACVVGAVDSEAVGLGAHQGHTCC